MESARAGPIVAMLHPWFTCDVDTVIAALLCMYWMMIT